MDNQIKSKPFHILNTIMEIDSFFINMSKEFSTYKNDLLTGQDEENKKAQTIDLNRLSFVLTELPISNQY
jgi:hypothetical protein